MKRTVAILTSAFLMIGMVASYVSYRAGFEEGIDAKVNVENQTDSVFGKIDYPLIDIAFDSQSKWVVINRSGLFTEQEMIAAAQDAQKLRQCSEGLRVLTFPVGRGTTPNGVIYVYKDGVLVKEVPYLEAVFEDNTLKDAFKQMEKKQAEQLIGTQLPSPV